MGVSTPSTKVIFCDTLELASYISRYLDQILRGVPPIYDVKDGGRGRGTFPFHGGLAGGQ